VSVKILVVSADGITSRANSREKIQEFPARVHWRVEPRGLSRMVQLAGARSEDHRAFASSAAASEEDTSECRRCAGRVPTFAAGEVC